MSSKRVKTRHGPFPGPQNDTSSPASSDLSDSSTEQLQAANASLTASEPSSRSTSLSNPLNTLPFPRELRDEIYKLIWHGSDDEREVAFRSYLVSSPGIFGSHGQRTSRSKSSGIREALVLTLISKQVRAEALELLDVLYKSIKVSFTLRRKHDIAFATSALSRWSTVYPFQISTLSHYNITVGDHNQMRFLERLTTGSPTFPSLRNLDLTVVDPCFAAPLMPTDFTNVDWVELNLTTNHQGHTSWSPTGGPYEMQRRQEIAGCKLKSVGFIAWIDVHQFGFEGWRGTLWKLEYAKPAARR